VRLLISIFTLVMLVAAASVAHASPGDDCGYVYADDFSGDKFEIDSFSHSYLADHLCFECLGGWLMFATDSTGNRGLGFYPGSSYGSLRPVAAYRFPLDGPAGGMAGTLEFDVLPYVAAAGIGGFGWAEVYIYYDDVRVVTAHISQSGHYSFEVAPPPTTAKVGLAITGEMFRLDNLSVCLDVSTPTRATSWGRIKSLYR